MDKETLNIGVLALQGDFAEHIATFRKCKGPLVTKEIRKSEELEGLHALVIPGGESTVIGKLLDEFGMYDHVKKFGESGIPMFGTCAGCILLSKSIDGRPDQKTLQLVDISVNRNAYGSQVDSFESDLVVDGSIFGTEPLRAILIRAPMITSAGAGTKTLVQHDGHPVLLQQGNLLACTFHPEITGDVRVHQYFVDLSRLAARAYSPWLLHPWNTKTTVR